MHWRNDEIDIEWKFTWRTHLSRWRGILLPFVFHIWPIYVNLTPVRYTMEHSFGLSYKTGKNNLRHTLKVAKCCCCCCCCCCYHFNLFLKKKVNCFPKEPRKVRVWTSLQDVRINEVIIWTSVSRTQKRQWWCRTRGEFPSMSLWVSV